MAIVGSSGGSSTTVEYNVADLHLGRTWIALASAVRSDFLEVAWVVGVNPDRDFDINGYRDAKKSMRTWKSSCVVMLRQLTFNIACMEISDVAGGSSSVGLQQTQCE